MCRLAAYTGPQIALQEMIIAPMHSLLEQSQYATEAKLKVSGDGFGVAWYGESPEPGLYRDILPAWTDGNLPNLCRAIRSPLFLAHVRASTTGGVARVNCHPFTYQNLSFMHNGQIPDFEDKRRHLESYLPDHLFHFRKGHTDSELIFLLLVANGVMDQPKRACERVLELLRIVALDAQKPTRLSCVFSNGEQLFAFRHSSDKRSPSLYVSDPLKTGGLAIASEPLDGIVQNWNLVPESHFIIVSGNQAVREPLDIRPLSDALN